MADMVDKKKYDEALDALELMVRSNTLENDEDEFRASTYNEDAAALRVLIDAGRMVGGVQNAKFVEYEWVLSPDDIETVVHLCHDKQLSVTEFREALRGLKRVKS